MRYWMRRMSGWFVEFDLEMGYSRWIVINRWLVRILPGYLVKYCKSNIYENLVFLHLAKFAGIHLVDFAHFFQGN